MAVLPRNRRSAVLAASLVLNVVLLAAGATIAVKEGFEDRRDHRHSPFAIPGPRQLKEALPERDLAMLETVLEAHRPDIFGRIGEVKEARRAAADMLRRETLSPEERKALLADLQQREAAVAAEVYRMADDLFGRLDAEGRRAIADLVEGPQRREK